MGQMRFLVPDRRSLPAGAIDRAYFTGLDEIPWRSRTQGTDEGLTCKRAEDDSGNFHISWFVPGHGELTLATGCLMEKDEPYHLVVELARGTINRIRNQLATWQTSGIHFNERLPLLVKSLQLLSKAVTSQHQPAAAQQFAEQALAAALDCMVQLSRAYSENSLAVRRKQATRAPSALGINLGSSIFGEQIQRYVVNSFNTCIVPFNWGQIEAQEGKRDWSICDRQVEWCRANSLKIWGGPLLNLDRAFLPSWVYLYEGDQASLHSFVTDFMNAVVARYQGRVNLWQCAARLNVHDTLDLGEEARLRLAALTIETLRAADPQVPVTLVIDQPWAEFMRNQECDFSPLHFADALVRADLGLAGIGLDLNVGYAQGSTQPRDLFDYIRLIDRWSSLGLPLLVNLVAPSSTEPDAKASSKTTPLAPLNPKAVPLLQARWLEQLLPVLLAKPAVQGIVWNQLLDSTPHDLPHGGLFDAANQPKPAATTLINLRQKFLG